MAPRASVEPVDVQKLRKAPAAERIYFRRLPWRQAFARFPWTPRRQSTLLTVAVPVLPSRAHSVR